jgi:16S rRNA (cytosine1402-N4)-methyltransferase
MSGAGHIPALLDEVIHLLKADREGIYIDGTLGLGGHAQELLRRNPRATLIGFDQDEKSLLAAEQALKEYADRVTLYHSDFRYLPDLDLDFSHVKGVLLDLGISSFQLDDPDRGFSYSLEGPLDMRMDLRNKTTSARILEKSSEPRLAQIFWEYGELRQSRKLAAAIVSRRKIKKITTTTELFRIVEDVCRWRAQRGKTHPAARVFQALRIEVNQELKDLDVFLRRLTRKIPLGARLAVISFHSLEDRIVKHTFVEMASDRDASPRLKILTRKPIVPSPQEMSRNFRSRSAKLRVVEKI